MQCLFDFYQKIPIWIQTGLRFIRVCFMRDVLFDVALFCGKTVSSIRRTFFHHSIRSNSVMTSHLNHRNINDRILICNELLSNKKTFRSDKSAFIEPGGENMMKFPEREKCNYWQAL